MTRDEKLLLIGRMGERFAIVQRNQDLFPVFKTELQEVIKALFRSQGNEKRAFLEQLEVLSPSTSNQYMESWLETLGKHVQGDPTENRKWKILVLILIPGALVLVWAAFVRPEKEAVVSTYSGIVLDASNGKPVMEAKVRLEHDQAPKEADSDSNGNFTFQALNAKKGSEALISISAERYESLRQKIKFGEPSIRFALTPLLVDYKGRVVDEKGKGIRNVRVRLNVEGLTPLQTTTNPEGNFTFLNIKGESAEIRFEAEKYLPLTLNVIPSEKEEQFQLSGTPPELLKIEFVDRTIGLEQIDKKNKSVHLLLDGATLELPEKGKFVLSVHTLELKNRARILMKGSNLILEAKKIDSSGGRIDSFLSEPPNAGISERGKEGKDAGSLTLAYVSEITGSLIISLHGQDGGRGGAGRPGSKGAPGKRGENAMDGLMECKRGGGDGGRGEPGGPGENGYPGGNGGNGGDLILHRLLPELSKLIKFQSDGGKGGPGGFGGEGGPGGQGGEGGSGSAWCSGGHHGPHGFQGPPGQNGPDGNSGLAGKIRTRTAASY